MYVENPLGKGLPVVRGAAALFCAVLLLGGARADAQETLSFPGRSSDLELGSYWSVAEFGEGCCTLDLNVRRFIGGLWRGGSGGATNEQDFTWNVPLYAPASGEIVSCWRSFPDDPSPGVNPSNNGIFTGGNHVTILTDQGNAIALAHLKADSIPAELCPMNADGTQYPSTLSKQEAWRVAAYVEPGQRPRVREGQYIGRAGNSGKSSGPHLHMSIHAVNGLDQYFRERLVNPSLPLRFRHGWGHRFEYDEADRPEDWYRLRGGPFTGDPNCATYAADSPSCGFKLAHPSPYLRRASAKAGAVGPLDLAFVSPTRAVTALKDGAGDLKLVVWQMDGIDAIVRLGDTTAGPIRDVQIVSPAPNHVLVAVRTQAGNLKMVAYRVTAGGGLVRVDSRDAGPVSQLAATVTQEDNPRAVTAVRAANGGLKLVAWDIVKKVGGASIVRLGSATAGVVSAVSISPATRFRGVFTAVRNASGDLDVVPWKLSAAGTFTRGAKGSAGFPLRALT